MKWSYITSTTALHVCHGHRLRYNSERAHFSDRPDILQNAINGDFALVPTITTLNKMLRYFKLPYNTNVVYRTRTSGAKFIKRRQILFTEVRIRVHGCLF